MTHGVSQSGLWGDRLFSLPLCQVMLWELFKEERNQAERWHTVHALRASSALGTPRSHLFFLDCFPGWRVPSPTFSC